MNTLSVLQALINSLFTTNGVKSITGSDARTKMNTVLGATYLPAGFPSNWFGPASTVPAGWHLMDGASFNITDYYDLFLALGGYLSPYGVNTGALTFQIPSIPAGMNEIQNGTTSLGTVLNIGAKGGEQGHTLVVSEMPSHLHLNGVGDDLGGTNFGIYGHVTDETPGYAGASVAIEGGTHVPTHQGITDLSGGGGIHNNMPPYIVVNKIIKLY